VKTWIALLRGINVGGRNSLPMKSLSQILGSAGCEQVKTYIQSGNVVFKGEVKSVARFSEEIGREIEAAPVLSRMPAPGRPGQRCASASVGDRVFHGPRESSLSARAGWHRPIEVCWRNRTSIAGKDDRAQLAHDWQAWGIGQFNRVTARRPYRG
jgi:hypothetical protein